MFKKIKRDSILKILSLLIAVGLWFYVAYAENPEIEMWYDGVQISYTGDDHFPSKSIVMAKSAEPDTVSLKIRGNRQALLALSAKDIRASVDLSSIGAAASYNLPINVSFPVDGITVAEKKPYTVSVTAEDIISRDFDVDVNIFGAPSEGHTVGEYTSSVEKVTVSGPRSEMEKAEKCAVNANVDGISAKFSNPLPIELFANDGGKIESPLLSFSNTYATVTINLNSVKKVKVSPVFADGEPKNFKVTPQEVTLSGTAEDVDKISEIKTETVHLTDNREYTASLIIPSGVQCEDDTKKVKIEVFNENN